MMLKRLPFPAASLGSGPRALTGLLITRSVAANAPAGALSSDQGEFGCVPYASRLSQSGQRSSRGGAGVGRGSGGTAPLKTPPLASRARDAPVTAVTVSGEMVSGTPGRGRGLGAGRGQREGHTGISAGCPVARLGSGRTESCAACRCSPPPPPQGPFRELSGRILARRIPAPASVLPTPHSLCQTVVVMGTTPVAVLALCALRTACEP